LASPFPEVETALDAWRAAKDSSGGVAAPAEALAKLAEVERERDALRDDLLAQVQGSTSTLKAVNACLDSVSARLALAEKVCDAVLPHVGWHGTTCDYHRDDCPQAALPEGCAACSIDSALNAALSAWRAAKDSTGSGVEGVEDAPGEAPEPGRATSLRGGHGPSYTRAEVDAAIAQAKREVVEVVLAAWSDATASLLGSGWSLDPRRFTAALRKAASRG
jgi:hypothetical protein